MRLTDRYTLESGRVYLTGIQALVRLPIDQMRRDRRAGLKTGAFISGYEGSPLGGYDLALARNRALLEDLNIHARPAVNEDLAATAIWGSQILETIEPARYDGILGIWYGKGPGVDRSGDALRHANFTGNSRQNAALVLAGDDPTSKSSTIPHQSDFSLYNLSIPFFFPGNTQEILDYGLYAVALSRFTGAWAGMKLVTNVCDGGGIARVDPDRITIAVPEGYQKRFEFRLAPVLTAGIETEVNIRRLDAARLFARHNPVNRVYGAAASARLGIMAAGKPYYDLMQALADLGISPDGLAALGIRIAKPGLVFPLESQFVRGFAAGLETILVVEEKRSFLELQTRDILFDLPQHPRVIGKMDEQGRPLFPPAGELDPDIIATVLARRLAAPRGQGRIKELAEIESRPREFTMFRMPSFCSGCPHNRSTLVPEGAAVGGGIGCHGMSMGMADSGRGFAFLTQMGGEGTPWIGMSPFAARRHMIQHIGDGTYFHSGAMAVSACIDAGVNITFKLMHNGYVAMTGGQPAAGAIPVPDLTRQLEAQGVRQIIVLSDDVSKYKGARFSSNTSVRDRSELMRSQHELAKIPGVTFLIYDQQCAAEKRRSRSRGVLAEPARRIVIHEAVCEGCFDCVRESNCASLQPVQTPLGEKIRIHQSSCNKDYTCLLGDCPSFVSVDIKPGTGLRKKQARVLPAAEVPAPANPVRAGAGYRILAPGIGGTGVVTINALLAAAAMLDGLSVLTLDQTGLAQKGGAVVSHLVLSESPIEASNRINAGNADLILGFDLYGSANRENLKCAHPSRTVAVVNSHLTPTADAVRKRAALPGPESYLAGIESATRRGRNIYVDAARLAESLFASHLATNVFLAGVAFQAGLLPVSLPSIEAAIRLNGAAVERNLAAFLWGRKYYADPKAMEREAGVEDLPGDAAVQVLPLSPDDEAWAGSLPVELRSAARRNLARLVHYKDEYEVARLLTSPEYERQILEMWEAPLRLNYHLHPPLLRRLGFSRKLTVGPWFKPFLKLLAACSGLRGTPFDVFGWTAHRRMERGLAAWYRELMNAVAQALNGGNLPLALEIANLPEQIRGFERVKEESVRQVQAAATAKLTLLRTPFDSTTYASSGKTQTEMQTG